MLAQARENPWALLAMVFSVQLPPPFVVDQNALVSVPDVAPSGPRAYAVDPNATTHPVMLSSLLLPPLSQLCTRLTPGREYGGAVQVVPPSAEGHRASP